MPARCFGPARLGWGSTTVPAWAAWKKSFGPPRWPRAISFCSSTTGLGGERALPRRNGFEPVGPVRLKDTSIGLSLTFGDGAAAGVVVGLRESRGRTALAEFYILPTEVAVAALFERLGEPEAAQLEGDLTPGVDLSARINGRQNHTRAFELIDQAGEAHRALGPAIDLHSPRATRIKPLFEITEAPYPAESVRLRAQADQPLGEAPLNSKLPDRLHGYLLSVAHLAKLSLGVADQRYLSAGGDFQIVRESGEEHLRQVAGARRWLGDPAWIAEDALSWQSFMEDDPERLDRFHLAPERDQLAEFPWASKATHGSAAEAARRAAHARLKYDLELWGLLPSGRHRLG